MNSFAIVNAVIINEGQQFKGAVLVKDEMIVEVVRGAAAFPAEIPVIDAGGKLLIPGVIDCHVHFREPGLTHKADLGTESRAAVAGGVTSFFEMPNTQPQATTLELLEEKFKIASEKSVANYSFFLGASNSNIEEIMLADPRKICGVKVFFGASTGNMLVDKMEVLEEIFQSSPLPVAAHCEDESIIKANSELMRAKYGEDVPVEMHPVIRNEDACYNSSELAVKLAKKYDTRLHITHLSTAKELDLMDNKIPLQDKKITTEACVHYLWFCDQDYSRLGTKLKVNPAIKSESDRSGLIEGLRNGKVDIISTDHAPHLLTEKAGTYFKAPSGTPLVQHALVSMLEMVKKGVFTMDMVIDKMCHTPAIIYNIEKRGFIRPGYFADLVLVDTNAAWTVDRSNVLSKCGWSVFEGVTFHSAITHTFVNGNLVYHEGEFPGEARGKRITFSRS
ncbi:MAG: dihydroorotase [Bacteroidales bacterium]|nr:dihydroorotase [Bacteroidales bacterium]